MKKRKKHSKDKGVDTMAATARNFVYEVKVNKKQELVEPTATKEFLKECKRVAEKYRKKK